MTSIALDYLGMTSIANSINYLGDGLVFLGSLYGDSQLLQLRSDPDAAGSFVDILETYPNIGTCVRVLIICSSMCPPL